MTKRKNMTKGERHSALESNVQQLQNATRLTQLLMQQTGQSLQNLQQDLSELASRQREIQYRLKAFQELSGLSLEDVNAKTESLQITDFNEFSAKDDEENGLVEATEVAEDSIVIFTTKAEGGGFLRSKQEISEIGFPQLKEDFIGKKVDDEFEADINGVAHTVKVLGIRKKEVVEEVVEEVTEESASS